MNKFIYKKRIYMIIMVNPMLQMVLGPYASPLARILEGAFFFYLVPVIVDYIILDMLLKVQRGRLFIASLLANGISFLVLEIIGELFIPASGLIRYFYLLPAALILYNVIIKTPIYEKLLSGTSRKEMSLTVLAARVIANIAQAVLLVIWGYLYLQYMA